MTTRADKPQEPRRPSAIEWLIQRWPDSTRRRAASLLAISAIIVATFIASSKLLRLVFGELDILAYIGLFVACWVGAGGAIVPIPGVRVVSWLMIVQQGAALDPLITALVAASAMLLGQTSYFLAARAAARHLREKADSGDEGQQQDDDDDDDAEPSRRARYMASAEKRVKAQLSEHGILTVFAVCALPTPMTSITTTAAASTGMSYLRFGPAAFGGYLLFASVLVLVGEGLFGGIRALFG